MSILLEHIKNCKTCKDSKEECLTLTELIGSKKVINNTELILQVTVEHSLKLAPHAKRELNRDKQFIRYFLQQLEKEKLLKEK